MIEPDYTLDLRGESCPYPLVETLEALGSLRHGEILAVTTDCPQSFRTIPAECPAHGHRLVADPVRSGAQMTFLLESGGRSPRRSRR